MYKYLIQILIIILGGLALPAHAQLMLGAGQRVAGLQVYPTLTNPQEYRYLPSHARLATRENGEPIFSFVFYVSDSAENEVEASSQVSSITEADGGAILHFQIEYNTDNEQIEDAQEALRQRMGDDELVIVGPVVFKDGKYSVISSVLNNEGVRKTELLAQRSAPLLQGNRTALSFDLEPELANILLATFKTATPDISITFDMEFSGLTPAYNADMLIDWAKTQESIEGGAGVKIYVVSLEAEAAIEKAFQDGAIQLQVNGDDVAMESLLELAYSKAMDILYAPIEVAEVPDDQQGDLIGALVGLIDDSAESVLPVGVSGAFKYKSLRSEGQTRLNFNKRTNTQQHAMLTTNLGGLYHQYGNDPDFFRVESTRDRDFDKRQVYVLVDGALAPDIGHFVNAIEITLNKQHRNGEQTLRELVVNAASPDARQTLGPMTYNNINDGDSLDWLDYQYKTAWSFVGGGRFESDWQTSDAATINLSAAYHRLPVHIESNQQTLIDLGVRSVVVQVSTDFFGRTITERRSIRVPTETVAEPISLVLPAGEYEYRYVITWVFNNRERRTLSGIDDLGFIFLDEVPAAAE